MQENGKGASSEVLLRVEHLCQYFRNGRSISKAVDDVSFEIRKGEVFGLVGESGCGKTTTGRAIIGLYDISAGNVYFRGERIAAGTGQFKEEIRAARRTAKDKKGLREFVRQKQREIQEARQIRRQAGQLSAKIQMIFQDPMASLDPRMTVYETIAEGLVIHGERDKSVIDRKVYEMLDLIGLVRQHASRYPHEFSGGQRQRIGIARAVVMLPELLIADEPVSALDVSVQAQVINLLDDLRERFVLTVLFIAHDLSVVKYFSDRIAVMYKGRIVELAESDELFAHPLHPYTRALLSSIPLPDPLYEKNRQRLYYKEGADAGAENGAGRGELQELRPGHFCRMS